MTEISFVSDLYRNVLFREPDAGGLSHWVNQLTLGGVSRDTVRAAFINSAEVDAFVSPIIRLYENILGRTPDAAGLNAWSHALRSGAQTLEQITAGFLNSPEGQAAGWSGPGVSGQDFVTKLYLAMGRTEAQIASDPGAGAWAYALNTGKLSPADAAIQINESLENRAGTDGFVTGYAALRAYGIANPSTEQARAFSGTATTAQILESAATVNDGVSIPTGPGVNPGDGGVAGQTFTLTNGVDNKVGTIGNDTFDALINQFGTPTFNSADTIDGAAGHDTLIAELNGGIVSATIRNVEDIRIITRGTSALDLINTTGAETLTLQNGSADLTVTNIASTDLGLVIRDQTSDVTLNFTNAALTGASTVKLTLNGAQSDDDGGAAITLGQQAGADSSGIETVTLDSVGNNQNFLNSLTATKLATLNVTGTQSLTIADALPTTVTAVNAGELAGGLSATFANATADMTVTGGAGNDSITLNANTGKVNVALGTGDDTIAFTGTATFTGDDTIAGGEGTDTLSITTAQAGAITAALANVSGIERLRLNSAAGGETVNATHFGDIAQVNLAAANNKALTLTLGAGTRTVTVGNAAGNANLTGIVTISDTGTGTTDALTLSNTNSTGTTDTFNGQTVTVNGFETVTVNTGAAVTAAQTLGTVALNGDSTTGANSLAVVGVNSLSFAGITSNSSGLLTIDGSGLTGNATLTINTGNRPIFSGGVTGTVSITGGANGDILAGHATAANTIDGGAGSDTIYGGTGADSLVGGAGNDEITGAGGNDTILGGAGNDTITAIVAGKVSIDGGAGDDTVDLGGTLSTGDTVSGGEGTDTLVLSAAATASTAGLVTGFEVLRLGAAVTQDLIQFTANSGFTTLQANFAGAVGFTNAGAGVTTLTALATGATLSLSRLVDTAADTLTVTGKDTTTADDGATTITALTVNDEETLNIQSGRSAGEDLTITALSASDLTTLNLSGAADVKIVAPIIGATKLATVSASTVQGAVTVDASQSTVAMTMTGSLTGSNHLTGGTGADTITGGTAADTINGGNGADVIDGGAGNDSLLGGIGADTITGGLGDDTITGGAGNDVLTGGEGADVFVFDAAATNGVDRITDFVVGTDKLDVDALLTGAFTQQAPVTAAGGGNSLTLVDHGVYYLTFNGAAANLTTGGTATLTTADLTASTLTALAAYLDELIVTTTVEGDDALFVVNWTAGGSTSSYLYHFVSIDEDPLTGTPDVTNTNTNIEAAELTLVGIIERGADLLSTGSVVTA